MRDLFLKIDEVFLSKFKKIKKNIAVDILSTIGHFFFCFCVILILFFIPGVEFKKIALLSTLSIILNTVVVFIVKRLIKRERRFKEGFYLNNIDPYSFPSGHVSRLAGFIIPTLYFPLISVIFLFFSLIASFARMAKGYHFFSDCLFGFIIGLSGGGVIFIFREFFYFF